MYIYIYISLYIYIHMGICAYMISRPCFKSHLVGPEIPEGAAKLLKVLGSRCSTEGHSVWVAQLVAARCIPMHPYAYVHTYVYMCIFIYIYTHTCMCVHIHIYIYMCTDAHLYLWHDNNSSSGPLSACQAAGPALAPPQTLEEKALNLEALYPQAQS